MQQTWNFTEAAEVFGIQFQGIGPLVNALGIETKPSRYHHKARLIDRNGMARLARALEKPWPPVETAVSA